MRSIKLLASAIFAVALLATPAMAQLRESTTITVKGNNPGHSKVDVPVQIFMPDGVGPFPAMIIMHGSGGVGKERELFYARELAAMGIAGVVPDSFAPRSVANVFENQDAVSTHTMLEDAFQVLKYLADDERTFKKNRIGVMGFSKGGIVALNMGLEARRKGYVPDDLKPAIHIPVYPGCSVRNFNLKTTGAPIHMFIASEDKYVNPEVCKEYVTALKQAGANITQIVYEGAQHSFEGTGSHDYKIARAVNFSACVLMQQADGSWYERGSGIIYTKPNNGAMIPEKWQQATAACVTKGASGGARPRYREAFIADMKRLATDALLK